MDKLEKYIRENKALLDDREPPIKAWHRIDDQLDREGVVPLRKGIGTYIWRAAAILLFAAVVGLLIDRNQNRDYEARIDEISQQDNITFSEVESFYIGEIREKQSLIAQFVANNPEISPDLMGEIDQLDSSYQELKVKMQQGYTERVLDAMVINLQMRIDILNKQLDVLEKIKNYKENEKATT